MLILNGKKNNNIIVKLILIYILIILLVYSNKQNKSMKHKLEKNYINNKQRFSKVIVMPPMFTYGDCMSCNGLLFFMLQYYEEIYLWIGSIPSQSMKVYFTEFYKKENRIKILLDPDKLLANNPHNTFHIINLASGNCKSNNYILGGYIDHSSNEKIHKKYTEKEFNWNLPKVKDIFYFNQTNPLYNTLDIEEKYTFKPNIELPLKKTALNHMVYFQFVGLNNNVRMDYFHYTRDIEEEKLIKKEILKRFNIGEQEGYNILNYPSDIYPSDITESKLRPFIKNNLKTINIDCLVDFPGKLLTLIEDAEEIHLVDTCNMNFIYHLQYKNLMKLKKINYHVWLRNRAWEDINLDYMWKSVSTPKLDNWNFIFEGILT